MSTTIVPLISSGSHGPLGVVHLPRLWSKLTLDAAGKLPPGYDSCGDGFDAMTLSAHLPADVSALRQSIIDFFEASMSDEDLVIPYAKQGLIGEVYESARVLSEDYDDVGTKLRVRALLSAQPPKTFATGPSGRR